MPASTSTLALEKLKQAIVKAGLSHRIDAIQQAAELSVYLVPKGTDDELSTVLGTSQIGGTPDLPRGVEWPREHGKPLSFLCQINLAEAASLGAVKSLPSTGLLSFFYDAVIMPSYERPGTGTHRIVIFPEGDLTQVAFPEDLENDVRFLPVPVRLEVAATLPAPTYPTTAHAVSPLFASLQLTPEEVLRYEDLLSLPDGDGPIEGFSILLDHPHRRFDRNLEMVSADRSLALAWDDPSMTAHLNEASQWVPLLEISSVQQAKMQWGDMGEVTVWIKRDDLLADRFEQSWVVWDCG